MAFEVGSRAPHGGIWVMPLMDNWWGFIIAVVVGMVVSAITVIIVKQVTTKDPEGTHSGSEEKDPATASA